MGLILERINGRYITYLSALCNYCKAEGTVVKKEALLDDLEYGDPPSPGSYQVLLNSYGGDLTALERSVFKARRQAESAWHEVERAGYECHWQDMFEPEAVARFRQMLRYKTEDCDFRSFALRRLKRLIEIIDENGQADIRIQALLDAYADLQDRRARRQLKKLQPQLF